jgi:hypothetical protein
VVGIKFPAKRGSAAKENNVIGYQEIAEVDKVVA